VRMILFDLRDSFFGLLFELSRHSGVRLAPSLRVPARRLVAALPYVA
jgi:hypothetical protein